MNRLLRLSAAGLVGALGFTLGAIFPLWVMLPLVLVVCGLIIGTAIVRDAIDERERQAEAARAWAATGFVR